MFDEKAQLHTLEGVAASALLLLVIIYAIDATSMTPLTSSTSSVHVESELAVLGQDILNTLDYAEPGYSSKLKSDVISWNGKEYLWNGDDYIINGGNDSLENNLAAALNATLIRRGVAHRVELTYLLNNTGIIEPSSPEIMINAGVPSDNSVIVSKKIVLQDTDCMDDEGCEEDEEDQRHIKDIDTSTNLYNIVDVKLILWRT